MKKQNDIIRKQKILQNLTEIIKLTDKFINSLPESPEFSADKDILESSSTWLDSMSQIVQTLIKLPW